MIREDKIGRPIYSDKIWNTLLEIGKRLLKLGFIETKYSNLFTKDIRDENGTKLGNIFADMRGTKYCNIWDDPRPAIYSNTLSFPNLMKETIILNSTGCNPNLYYSIDDDHDCIGLDYLRDGEGEIIFPSGFCRRCNRNIINEVDWNVLSENVYDLDKRGINPIIETHYCGTCRKIEYSIDEFRKKDKKDVRICEICRDKPATLEHHIIYTPERIINICVSCHGKIHKFGKNYPNPLWKQRKNEIE